MPENLRFRAIAGIWPFGSGTISVPAEAEVMLLPQRPYFPVASVSSAIAYPAEPGTFDNETIKAALNAVGLPAMAERLEEEAHWNRMLSLGSNSASAWRGRCCMRRIIFSLTRLPPR